MTRLLDRSLLALALPLAGMLSLILLSAAQRPASAQDGQPGPDLRAPDQFLVTFETSTGPVVLEVYREWAPTGADRFYTLVQDEYFDGNTFFRVVPGFVVQFGIHGNPEVSNAWRHQRIRDDEPTQTNAAGTLTFATSGPNARTTQMFINLENNGGLDSQGFAPIGRVIAGMENIQNIYAGYGQRPEQGQIYRRGDAYLDANFPLLDRIDTARVTEESSDDASE